MDRQTRRRFLQTTGTIGTIGALAGCTGGGGGGGGGAEGGDGGDGGDGAAGDGGGDGGTGDGGDGGGGDGGGGATQTPTKSGQREQLLITSFPLAVPQFAYAHQQGIVEEEFAKAGYDVKVQFTFQGPALFAAGKSDIAIDVSSLEAARMGVERGIDISVTGKMMTSFLGMLYKAGSKWDPKNTGGVQATIDKVAKQGANLGIFGWAAGNVPAEQIVLDKIYNKQLRKEGGDFSVVTAKPPAVPKLLEKGDLAIATSSPIHGAAPWLMEGTLKPLYWESDILAQNEVGVPPLINIVTRDGFIDGNRPAIKAMIRSWNRGAKWYVNQGVQEITNFDLAMKHISAKNAKPAKYTVRWTVQEDVTAGFESDTPRYYQDATLTDGWIESNKRFLNNVAAFGQAPTNWQERVSYVKIEP